MASWRCGLAVAVLLGAAMTAGTAVAETEFIVRIYNAGTEDGMILEDGTTDTPLLSWGVFAVHREPYPLFTPGQPAGRFKKSPSLDASDPDCAFLVKATWRESVVTRPKLVSEINWRMP